jgi:membrane associated rhomboid family serine protease
MKTSALLAVLSLLMMLAEADAGAAWMAAMWGLVFGLHAGRVLMLVGEKRRVKP